jgi:hypothetical protein
MTLLTEPPWVTGASQSGAAPSEQEATMESNGGFPLNVASLEAECAQSTKSVKASGFGRFGRFGLRSGGAWRQQR